MRPPAFPPSAPTNLVVVPVGADGKIQRYNRSAGTVQVFADVAGHYPN